MSYGLAKYSTLVAFVLLVTSVLPVAPARAHDIPDEIVVQMFVKPQGERLHVLMRVPLALLLNMDLPKRGPGYLDLARVDEPLDASAKEISREIAIFEDDTRLVPTEARSRISILSDSSFESYERAAAHVNGPELPESTNVFWNQGYFDLHLEYQIRSQDSDFALQVQMAPEIQRRLHLIVQFMLPDGRVRAYDLAGPSGRIGLDPRWYQAAWSFTRLGVAHILGGIDHLLFLFCLVIPFRRERLEGLVKVVTAFTIAHSVTLVGSAYDLGPGGDWFPPLVETLIAASIVYMALENIVVANLQRRWLIAVAFGLVHGFGFAYALRESFQLAGDHLLLSLLSFNLGVELGQIAVLLVVIPVLRLLFRFVVQERLGAVILSAFLAHTGWHWMLERAEVLRYVQWPVPDVTSVLDVVRWAVLLLAAAGLIWQGRKLVERRVGAGRLSRTEETEPSA